MENLNKLQEWKENGKYFQYNNFNIFYQESNPESTSKIVFLHGFPTSSWDYHLLWNKLKEKNHLLCPDFIGFGFSDKPKKYAYSIMDQTDMIIELVKKQNCDKVIIVAHNYGSIVGQELLARHNENKLPFKIEKLIFLNGALFPELHQPTKVQKLLLSPLGHIIVHLLNKKRFEKSISAVFGRDSQPDIAELDNYWELVKYNDGIRLTKKLLHYIDDRKKYGKRWTDAMCSTDVNIKFINGIDDPVSGIHVVEKYIKTVPNPNVSKLENIGHYPQIEAPEQVLEAIEEFVYN